MSPEQCRGNVALDERTDVYALGVMLFELLAGRPPFRSTGFGELVAMHMFDPVPPLGSLAPQTPPEVAQLVERMLAKSAVVLGYAQFECAVSTRSILYQSNYM